MSPRACILGCSGLTLTQEERAFFRQARPWGFILFARNVKDVNQTRALADALRECIDDEAALVFIDQEGGRVQRARPPIAANRPPASRFGSLYASDPQAGLEAVHLNHRLMAEELRALGVNADCAPCIDLLHEDAHDIVGDRSFGAEPSVVSALGRAAIDGLMAGGCAPVIKHIPGHGRARADSHLELPVVPTPLPVLEATDFEPFRALADAPMAMTAHVVFTAVDPDACVTVSRHAIQQVIRGFIGFDNLLMSDDLSMKALGGAMQDRAQAALDAGCDVLLHCNGDMAEMQAAAQAAPHLSGRAAERAEGAKSGARDWRPIDVAAAEERLAAAGLGARRSA